MFTIGFAQQIELCLEDGGPVAMIQEAVLGLLAKEPVHGYALWQTLQGWSTDPESIQSSSIYNALRRLNDQGAVQVIASAPAPQAGERPRHTYAITADGRARLDGWLAQRPTTVEDLRLRITLAQPADDLAVLIDWVVEELADTQRRLGTAPIGPREREPASWDSAYALAMSRLAFYELSAKAQWLAEAHAQLQQLRALTTR